MNKSRIFGRNNAVRVLSDDEIGAVFGGDPGRTTSDPFNTNPTYCNQNGQTVVDDCGLEG